MRITELQMQNFMSHENTRLDFRDMSLGIVVGNNGAGKSTLLEAITYGLWGQVRTGSHNDVVQRGKTSCAVRVTFEIRGQQYQVTRRRHLKGNGSSDLEFVAGDVVLTGHTIRQTQEEINGMLGMSYDLFVSSALLQQGDADRFSRARPGERKELLAEMLSLGWFQELEKRARQRLSGIKDGLREMEAVADSLHRQVEEIPEFDEDDWSLLADKRDLCRNELTSNKAQLEKLRQELSDLKDRLGVMDKLMDREVAYIGRIVELEETIQKLEDEQGILDGWVLRQNEITESRYFLREQLARKRKLDEVAHLQNTAAELGTLLTKLEEEHDAHDTFFTELESIKAIIEEGENEIASLELRISEIETDRNEAQSVLAVAEEGHKRMRSQREMLAEASICPTCLQEIEDYDGLLADIDKSIKQSEDGIWKTRTRISEIDALKQEAKEDLAKMKAHLFGDTELKSTLESDVLRSELKIQGIKAEIAQCEAARERLEEVDFDPDEYTQLAEDVEELPEIEELYAQMNAGLARLETVDADLEEAKTSLGKGNLALVDLRREIDELQEEIGTFEPEEWLVEEIEKLNGEVEQGQGNLSALEARIATVKERERQRKELQGQLDQLESDIGLGYKERDVADLLVKASSKTGAQALLIEAALPQIEDDANNYLERMSPGMRLLLNTQRETLKGSAMETMDIVVYANGQEAPIETLSGGERFRADLALRLAIGRMLSRRSGTRVEMLAIDEGFGSQDDTGQQAVVDAIVSLGSVFDLILVISHVRSVADALGSMGSTIEIEKVGGKSVVKVI